MFGNFTSENTYKMEQLQVATKLTFQTTKNQIEAAARICSSIITVC